MEPRRLVIGRSPPVMERRPCTVYRASPDLNAPGRPRKYFMFLVKIFVAAVTNEQVT